MGLAAFIGTAGALHFLRPAFFDQIVPRWMPGRPRTTTYVSGLAELAGAALVANPRTRRFGARWCFWTFLGVYPANIQHVVDGGVPGQEGFAGTGTAALIRLPLQLPMFLWARRVAREAAG